MISSTTIAAAAGTAADAIITSASTIPTELYFAVAIFVLVGLIAGSVKL